MKFSLCLMFAATCWAQSVDPWEDVRGLIDGSVLNDFSVSVGDSRGELFRHSTGNTTFDSSMRLASSTKWVSGVVVMSVLESGLLNLDDRPSEYLDYWTTDDADPRSRVTLRHLLSFVAGVGGSTACPAQEDFLECVETMYSRSTANSEPGTEMAYNEVALMYAGAMASVAAGTSIERLFEQYIFEPCDMQDTFWSSGRPLLGSGLTTTAEDYGKFLSMYFNGDLVSQETRTEMERCHYPDAALTGSARLQGQYGLANWFLCIPSINGFRDACQVADLHSSPGASGYYPTTDRRHDFWMQIANQAGSVTASGFHLRLHPAVVEAVLESRG